MKTIILAAGYGTRLHPITKDIAKPLLSVRGTPIIEYIVRKIQLIKAMEEIFIVSNHRFFNQFREWLDGFPNTVPIKLIDDGSTNPQDRLGAIKDLALVIERENLDDDLLVVGGDNLFSFSLNDFIDYALKIKPELLIGIYNLNGKLQPNKFGVVKLNGENRVIEFFEKPSAELSSLVSICLYFFPKGKINLIREYLKLGNNPDTIGNYIHWLVDRDRVYGFDFKGTWLDIGDIDSYTEAIVRF